MSNWHSLLDDFPVERQPPCAKEALRRAEDRLGLTLPSDLHDLLRQSDGLYDTAGQWYFVWPLEQLVSSNLTLRTAGTAPPDGLIAFGDDGTGAPFCMALSDTQTVSWWSPIARETHLLADSLGDFIVGWLSGSITT